MNFDLVLKDQPWLGKTVCEVCREETLFQHYDPVKERSGKRIAPRTCGRYKCMVETGETKAIGALPA